jgi:hypothetical protein
MGRHEGERSEMKIINIWWAMAVFFGLISTVALGQSSANVVDAETFIDNIVTFNGQDVTVSACRIRMADPVRIGCFPPGSSKWFLVDRRFLDKESIDRLVNDCSGLEDRTDNCLVEVHGTGNMDFYKTPLMKHASIQWKKPR